MTSLLRALVAVATLFATPVTWAANLIVDADYVEDATKRGAIVWDARDSVDYARGHIPGAFNLGNVADVFRDQNREDPPSATVAARLFGAAGMDILGKEVVVYTRKGDPFAYYAARMIEYYGGKHGKVLHGGIEDWRAADKPVETTTTTRQAIDLALKTEGRGIVSDKEVVERVKNGRAQILDARTVKEYTGEDVRAIRGGHIPGAINIPYEENWKDPTTAAKIAAKQVNSRDGMDLKGRDELARLYSGLDPSRETVIYCQSGVRASETAAVLRDLGFKDVRVHESSWLGYAGNLSAPAENEVFINVGALNARIAELQARVRELEAKAK